MSLREDISNDVLEIQSDLGEANTERSFFAWAGSEIPCAATTELSGIDLSTTGNPANIRLALLVRQADCPTGIPPSSGSKLTWNGRAYKVDENGVRNLHGGAAWLYCTDWNSR